METFFRILLLRLTLAVQRRFASHLFFLAAVKKKNEIFSGNCDLQTLCRYDRSYNFLFKFNEQIRKDNFDEISLINSFLLLLSMIFILKSFRNIFIVISKFKQLEILKFYVKSVSEIFSNIFVFTHLPTFLKIELLYDLIFKKKGKKSIN